MTGRVAALMMVLLSAGCGGSPSAPVGPAPPVPAAVSASGFWSGELRWTGCIGLRHCFALLDQVEPFALNLRPGAGGVDGLLVTRSLVAEVSGAKDAAGRWVLTGFTPAASERDHGGTIDVRRLELALEGTHLSGSVAFRVMPGSWAGEPIFGPIDYTATLLTARRGAGPTGYPSRWTGQHVVRACATTWTSCYPVDRDEVRPLALTLSGSGGAVAGGLDLSISGMPLPVSGTFLGGTLTLGEAAVRRDNSELRLLSLTATLDEFGRLRGRLTYRLTYFLSDGESHTDYEAELWQVVSFRP